MPVCMAIKQSGETHFYFPSLFLPWSLKMLRQGSKAKSNEPRHEPGLTKVGSTDSLSYFKTSTSPGSIFA
ncbi:hypothetical protein CDL15_Pgr010577 [Punica granatum]|uniref:Uncharacterized protein n=1 Tax=Punica granatum TaxID=22663 RepID=A0A218WY79_PUNGR|nr:hypothetical protein CDL15_Pgr010577 [Punica granatum]